MKHALDHPAFTEPDEPKRNGGATTAGFVLGLLALPITTLILGAIKQGSAIHTFQGFPIILGAFGAAIVATGVFLHQFEYPQEMSIRIASRRYERIKQTILRELALDDAPLTTEQSSQVATAVTDIETAARRRAFLTSFAAGLDLIGAAMLFVAGGIGVWAWWVLPQ